MALDLKGLAQRVEDVLPDRVARAAQLTALADSLVYISARNPSIWLVHVLSDRVRLFAGRLIVLTLQRQSLWVTVEDAKGVDELASVFVAVGHRIISKIPTPPFSERILQPNARSRSRLASNPEGTLRLP
jgi:hypothetical protein